MICSVIITSYDIDRYEDLRDSVKSVLNQNYKDIQLVLVLEDKDLVKNIQDDFDDDRIKIDHAEEKLGLSKARNKGAKISDGDFIVFTDDDIVADNNWISELLETYESEEDAFGVGGRCDPIWPATSEPSYIPPEFYWIFGVTHKHHPSQGVVRNTFGCNIGFEKDLFLQSGGLNTDLGKRHGKNIQGEETEICYRIRSNTGKKFYYNSDALVKHKVYTDQLKLKYLFDRCFWQGYTKRIMKSIEEDSISNERSYLRDILIHSNIENMKSAMRLQKPIQNISQSVMILLLTFFVGIGFLYGKIAY